MADRVIISKDKLTSVCDILRDKTGEQNLIKIDDIPGKIEDFYFTGGDKVKGEIESNLVQNGYSVEKGDVITKSSVDASPLDFNIDKLFRTKDGTIFGFSLDKNENNNYDLNVSILEIFERKLIKKTSSILIPNLTNSSYKSFDVGEYSENCLVIFYQMAATDSEGTSYNQIRYKTIKQSEGNLITSEEFIFEDENNYHFYPSERTILLDAYKGYTNILYFIKEPDKNASATTNYVCAVYFTVENDTFTFHINNLVNLSGSNYFNFNAYNLNILANNYYTELAINTETGVIKTPTWLRKKFTDVSLYTSDTYSSYVSSKILVNNGVVYVAGAYRPYSSSYNNPKYDCLISFTFRTIGGNTVYYGMQPSILSSERIITAIHSCFNIDNDLYIVGSYNNFLRFIKTTGSTIDYIISSPTIIIGQYNIPTEVNYLINEDEIYFIVKSNDKDKKTYLVSINQKNRVKKFDKNITTSKPYHVGIALNSASQNETVHYISF